MIMFNWFKKKTTSQHSQSFQQEDNFNDTEAKILLSRIKERFGLDYKKQEFITINKIKSFTKQHGFHSFFELETALQTNNELYKELINLLTVNETYFFRELHQIEYLQTLAKENSFFSILSAPCASGEEVYTLLIYLQEIMKNDIHITGIDINTQALQKAKTALYSKRSISKIPPEILQKYFIEENGSYKFRSSFKQNTSFIYKNVFENLQDLGKFDIIFSRNMLIYFDQKEKEKALRSFYDILHPNGYLFLGHADIIQKPEGFKKVHKTLHIFQKE